MDINQLQTLLQAVAAASRETAAQETLGTAVSHPHHQPQQLQLQHFSFSQPTDSSTFASVSSNPASLPSGNASLYTPQQQPQDQSNQERIEELRQKTRRHVEQAIRVIPMEHKAAYLEALEKSPAVVQDETDPMLFVRTCSYNIWDAANRLCLYWRERKELFGDRAFLPLTLTEDGALSKQAILGLHAGFPAILPNNSKSGQKVVFCDRRKFIPSATREDRLKSLFYVHKMLAQDESAQVEGVMVFVLLITPRFGEVDFKFVQKAFYLNTSVFPTKSFFHFLQNPPQAKVGKSAIVSQITSTVQKMAIESGLGQCRVYLGKKPMELLEILRTMGLADDGIPDCVGGKWQFERFFSWCRDQEARERRIYRDLLEYPIASESAAPAPLTAEQKQERKRLADVIHSRRKRQRQKQGLLKLQDEAKRQTSENTKLVAQNALLKDLLARAKGIVQSLSQNAPFLAVDSARAPPAAGFITQDSYQRLQPDATHASVFSAIQQQQQQQHSAPGAGGAHVVDLASQIQSLPREQQGAVLQLLLQRNAGSRK